MGGSLQIWSGAETAIRHKNSPWCQQNHSAHSVVLHLFLHKLFSGRKCYVFLLLASYPSIVWMDRRNKNNSQYLPQSKIPCSDIYSNWLKRITWRLELKQISFLEVILIQIWKFNMPIKKKSEILISHLNFKIQLQQKSKFEIYILFLKKLKIDEKIRFLRII